jgi:hypothetical protein
VTLVKQVIYQITGSGTPRKISVKARQGEDAAVVVTAVHGTVWISIAPPFMGEAIIGLRKVDEVVRALELARDEARKMAETAQGKRAAELGEAAERAGCTKNNAIMLNGQPNRRGALPR